MDEPGIVAGAVARGQPLFRIKSRTLLKLSFVYAAIFFFEQPPSKLQCDHRARVSEEGALFMVWSNLTLCVMRTPLAGLLLLPRGDCFQS